MDLEQDVPGNEPEPAAPLESPVEETPASSDVGLDGGAAVSRQDDAADVRRQRDDALAAQARFYQVEFERTRRELEELRAAQRVDPREEQARLEAMDPVDQVKYLVERGDRESQNQIAQMQAYTNAQLDQLKFDAQLKDTAANLGWSSAQRAKYSGEIEAMYNNLASRNMTIPRVELLKHKLGDELMTSGAKAIKGASERGKANIERQTARMTPASSNVTGKSTGKSEAEKSRERMLNAGVLEM